MKFGYVIVRFAGLIAFAGLLVGCGDGGNSKDDTLQSISGKVIFKGEPVKSTTIVVSGPNNASAGGTSNEQGEYIIPNPPTGLLKFQLIPAGKVPFPAKYTKANNDLTFDYQGGKQTFNLELKP